MDLVEEFEAARPRLLSLAHRIVGSHHDAEDAVQTAWLRTQSAGQARPENPDGWFSTVTARACLDQLRARRRRGEVPLTAGDVPGERLAADEAFLQREDVSRALLVLLAELTPEQRVSYVLHDLFALPFDQVATVLDTTAASAKKLASRARIRLRAADPAGAPVDAGTEIVEAFLAAARGGDIGRLVALLAPDAVRTADPRLLPEGAQTTVRGATAVAEETRYFVERILVTVVVLRDGVPHAIIAPGGHPLATIRFGISDDGRITVIDIRPCPPGTAPG